jgi:hypothetical protein
MGRKCIYIDSDLHKDLKHLATDEEIDLKELTETIIELALADESFMSNVIDQFEEDESESELGLEDEDSD